jgi:SAM-dependent methyltransferase
MKNEAERRISAFYNTVGWESVDGVTEDARLWEDLREHAAEYVSRCRLRVLRHVPEGGRNFLDMASGPIQYPEYLEFSRNYEKRYCVDLSAAALESARRRIGEHGVFLHGSFFDLPLEPGSFDCTVSLHTLCHIDRDRQEEAVRKLVEVTAPGKPVIVVYGNPDSLTSRIGRTLPGRLLRRVGRLLRRGGGESPPPSGFYFFLHPLSWWERFSDVADVQVLPWRSFGANVQKRLFPDSPLGRRMLGLLFRLEDRFPRFFARNFTYVMVVLTRHPESARG